MSIHDSQRQDKAFLPYRNIINRADGLRKAIADTDMNAEIGISIAKMVLHLIWTIGKKIDMDMHEVIMATLNSIADGDDDN